METIWKAKGVNSFGGEAGIFKHIGDVDTYWIGLNLDDDKTLDEFSKEAMQNLYQALKNEFESVDKCMMQFMKK